MAFTTTKVNTATGYVSTVFNNGVKAIESFYNTKNYMTSKIDYLGTTGTVSKITTFTYNSKNMFDKITITDANGKVIDVQTYSYNAKGQIDQITHTTGVIDYYTNGVFHHSSTTVTPPQFTSDWSPVYGYGQIDVIKAFSYAGVTIKDTMPTTKTDWNMLSTHFDDAWAAGYTGKGIVIANIDSGIDMKNIELTHNLHKDSWNFVTNTSNIQDEYGHGSFTASLITAVKDNDLVTGAAYDAELMVLKISDAKGIASIANCVKAIYYAVDHGADIINLSMNSYFNQPTIEKAFQYANDHNVLVSVSSGNNLGAVPQAPANYAKTCDNVVAVGATMAIPNKIDYFAAYSNKAGGTTAYNYVDAPGTTVSGFNQLGNIVTMTGTSMAAPMVAAEMAILKQYLESTQKYAVDVIDEMVVDFICKGTYDINIVGSIAA